MKWIGRPLPRCSVVGAEGGGVFDHVVGPRWAIVAARDPREIMGEYSLRCWQALGAAFVEVPEPEGSMLALLMDNEAAIVRPDRIIYSAGDASARPALGAAGRLERAASSQNA